jgi:murein DD-endopeptidase MepM/ murein hydrolase activator NlpD
MDQLGRFRERLAGLFPERRLYLRSGGEMRAFVLSPQRQMTAAAAIVAAALWITLGTAALLIDLAQGPRVAQPPPPSSASASNPAALAALVERRHQALLLLLADMKDAPGAAQALAPPISEAMATAAAEPDPAAKLKTLAAGQDQVLKAADSFAQTRAERLRAALKLAGVAAPAARRGRGAQGGPLIEADDPRALAAALGVDAPFARRMHQAAVNLSAAQALDDRAERLPLGRPTREGGLSSGFGIRIDPFTRRAAFHPGMDFSGARMTPVYATAAGVVAFAGGRNGYGRTVEVDHGGGIMTRYAHLARIEVREGERLGLGAELGRMGSTGRSTGPHLHYEIWMNGRVQNPAKFVRAGAYVREGTG